MYIAENEALVIEVRYSSVRTINMKVKVNLGICITGTYSLNQNVIRLDKT